MAELKANQAKKTSVEPRASPDDEKHDMSKSFSSSFAQKKTSETFEVRAASMEVKSGSFEVFKGKEKEPPIITSTSIETSSSQSTAAKSTTKISITENSSSVMTSSAKIIADDPTPQDPTRKSQQPSSFGFFADSNESSPEKATNHNYSSLCFRRSSFNVA